MWPTLIAALSAIFGVALGGGVRAWEADRARKKEAEGLLSALVAEVEAITRLARHRQYAEALHQLRANAQTLIDNDRTFEKIPWLTIHLVRDYFVTYNISLAKIGLLHPYYADRITRFYTFAKASLEDYDKCSPYHVGVNATEAVALLDNDLMLLNTMMMLGDHIATFRKVEPPKGIFNPFDQPPAAPNPPFMSIEAPVTGAAKRAGEPVSKRPPALQQSPPPVL